MRVKMTGCYCYSIRASAAKEATFSCSLLQRFTTVALTLKKEKFTLKGSFYCLAINFTYAGIKDTKELGIQPSPHYVNCNRVLFRLPV